MMTVKSIDQCRARGYGGWLRGLECEIADGTEVSCSTCGRVHMFHVSHDGATPRIEIERKRRAR